MTIDGMQGTAGKIFTNVALLARDSLYVLLKPLLTSLMQIDFFVHRSNSDSGANQQNIELVTLIQDAVFLYPQRFADGTKETLPIGEQKN
jgi:hypothetical protein